MNKKKIDVLKHIANGDTIDQTADAMCLSRSSVEKYLQSVRHILNARTLAHAVYLATKQGFIMLLITVVLTTPTGRIVPRHMRVRTRNESTELL
jgi:DNA-binding CsgD family transcriptional regulator